MMRSGTHSFPAVERRRYIGVPGAPLGQLAETVVTRLTELLYAPVWILDERGAVIANKAPLGTDRPLHTNDHAEGDAMRRIPLRLEGRAATVVIADPVNGETISPRLAHALTHLVVGQVHTAERMPQQHERKNGFVYNLLRGMLTDETTIIQEARTLGLDLDTPRAVLLIDAGEYILKSARDHNTETHDDTHVRRRAQLVIGSIVGFFHLPNDTICSYIGNGEIAVLKASNSRNLRSWVSVRDIDDGARAAWANLTALKRAGEMLVAHLHSDIHPAISVGIGRYHPDVHGIARSYQDARAALSLGRRCDSESAVHCLDGLGTTAFIGVPDERTKVELATHLLSPLDHEPELVDTLRAFFTHDCCPSVTAQTLAIHRNTLAYRLQKIASLTGLDPRHFDDATQMHLALLTRALGSRPS